jgi:hypothetical protein
LVTGWLVGMDIPVGLGREEAQRRAAEELAKAKYGGSPSWLEDALDRLLRLVEKLYDFYLRLIGDQSGAGGGVNWGFVVAVTVLLVAVALVVWKVGLPKWRGRAAAGQVELDSSTPAADYRALAAAHAERGDWQSAVRDQFRALVRELETRTILQVRPARTAWEAAYSAVRVVPESQPVLFEGADLFNRVVYGEERADPASYQRMMAIDTAVLEIADRVDLAADETVGSSR